MLARGRRGDRAGGDRDDGRRAAAPSAAARGPGDDDARPAVGRADGARRSGSASTATASTRCSTSRRRTTGPGRGARRRHRGCSCRCSRATPVAQLDGRVTTAAGRAAPRVPIWIAGRTGFRAGPRRVARHGLDGLALVGADEWSPDRRRRRARRRWRSPPARSTSSSSAARTPIPPPSPPPARRGACPEILPGATAADALGRARRPADGRASTRRRGAGRSRAA